MPPFVKLHHPTIDAIGPGELQMLAVLVVLMKDVRPWPQEDRGEQLSPSEVLVSARRLAERCGVSKDTITRTMQALTDRNLMELRRRTTAGTVYRIPTEVADDDEGVPFADDEPAVEQGVLSIPTEPPAPTLAQLYPVLDKVERAGRNYAWPAPFAEFLEAYPKRPQGNPAPGAYSAWRKIVVKKKATPAELLDAAERFAKSWERQPAGEQQYIPMASSWMGRSGEWLTWIDGDPISTTGRQIKEL